MNIKAVGNVTGGVLAIGLFVALIYLAPSMSKQDTLAAAAAAGSSSYPQFSVHRNYNNLSVPTNEFVKVPFTDEIFDTANNFDLSSSRFRPRVEGYYLLTAGVGCNENSTAGCNAAIYKNGTREVWGLTRDALGHAYATGLIHFNGTTDYAEVYGFNNGGTSFDGAKEWTFFQGTLAGAATSPTGESTAAPYFNTFKTVTAINYTPVSTDVGTMVSFAHAGGATVSLPSPSTLPVGVLGFRLDKNDSSAVEIKRADGQTIGGWNHLIMDMYGDYVHIANTGSDYIVTAQGQVPQNGLRGQHRTPVASFLPGGVYNVRKTDRGAILRVVPDTGDATICLPKKEDMGFAAEGYRNGFQIAVMAVNVTGTNTVKVYPDGCAPPPTNRSAIENQAYVELSHNMEIVWLDFDSQAWFILSHYIPSGTVRP